eukprot:140711-Prorocentrum_minimum.AAC.5
MANRPNSFKSNSDVRLAQAHAHLANIQQKIIATVKHIAYMCFTTVAGVHARCYLARMLASSRSLAHATRVVHVCSYNSTDSTVETSQIGFMQYSILPTNETYS